MRRQSKIRTVWYMRLPVSSRLDISLAWRLLFCIGQINFPCCFNTWSVCMLAALKLPAAFNTTAHEKLLGSLLTVLNSDEERGWKPGPWTLLKSMWLKNDSLWFSVLVSWGLIVFPALVGLHSWSRWYGFLKALGDVFWLIWWGRAKVISACGPVKASKK